MNRTTKTLAALALVAATLVPAAALADRRNFTFIYEPKTLDKGQLEIEYYMTAAVTQDKLSGEHNWNWAHQVEVEYGVTERFDLAMYQMFNTEGWLGYKLRARFRPWHYGTLPFDLMLYLEWIQKPTGDIALEERVVVGTTLFDKLYISLDTMVEQGPLTGDVGFKLHEGLGIGYEIAPWFVLGLETQLRFAWQPKDVFTATGTDTELEFSGARLYMGPTLSFAVKKIWWDVNVSFRVAGEEDDTKYLFRVLWGIFL